MLSLASVVFSALITLSWSAEDLTLPPRFEFGVASSAYQIEGAWNASDKSESIWDRYFHNANRTGQDNGDVACDSYHLWRRDVEMVAKLGVNFYRFSIAWTRILPKGFSNYISKEGAKYYSDLIDALLEKGIEPVVTIHHWDLPQRLQDLGGWTNPLMTTWFADYARVLYTLYGDRVKTWITINEPLIFCDVSYRSGILAPAIMSPDIGIYLCVKHHLVGHAKAWRIYDEEFRSKYKGRVSLTNFLVWIQPASEEDEDLAKEARQLFIGLYSHPIFGEGGGWPPAAEKAIAKYSKKRGYPRSILPALSEAEVTLLKGTYDFYGVNYYSGQVIRRAKPGEEVPNFPFGAPEFNAKLTSDPSWEKSDTMIYPVYPEGLRKQLNWVQKEYGNVPIIICENGFGTFHEGMNDTNRITFIRDHLKQISLAFTEDGIIVDAFTLWSLMDNYEWISGYKNKFGLYAVNFTSPNHDRTARSSARYYSDVIKQSKIVSTSKYVYTFGGLLVAAVLIAAILFLMMRQRNSQSRGGSYQGVKTEEYHLPDRIGEINT